MNETKSGRASTAIAIRSPRALVESAIAAAATTMEPANSQPMVTRSPTTLMLPKKYRSTT